MVRAHFSLRRYDERWKREKGKVEADALSFWKNTCPGTKEVEDAKKLKLEKRRGFLTSSLCFDKINKNEERYVASHDR